MKNNYIAPEAEILCFRPVEDLAWTNLLDPSTANNPGSAADKLSGDVFVKI